MTGIVIGLPVDEGLRAQLARATGLAAPAVYAGSVARPCPSCGLDVYVGPRQQAALDGDPALRLLCVFCAKKFSNGHDLNILNLGNPEERHVADDKPLLTLACYCGFKAETPEAFADHCLLTKHVTDIGGTDDGELAGSIAALGDMQRYVSGEAPLPEGVTITALSEADILNDEDLSPAVKAHLIDTARAIAEGKDDEES